MPSMLLSHTQKRIVLCRVDISMQYCSSSWQVFRQKGNLAFESTNKNICCKAVKRRVSLLKSKFLHSLVAPNVVSLFFQFNSSLCKALYYSNVKSYIDLDQ